MSAPKPPVTGMFYIDDVTDDFYLYEALNGVTDWYWKGRLARSNIVGFYGEGPFLGGDRFELATSATKIIYHSFISEAKSSVRCEVPPSGPVDVVVTGDLAEYLAYGDAIICRAHFDAGTNVATLTFNDQTIAAGGPVWLVLPDVADPTFAGLHALIAGQPS